jgi:RNA polymerase sigma-70 factor, ECF subfamily
MRTAIWCGSPSRTAHAGSGRSSSKASAWPRKRCGSRTSRGPSRSRAAIAAEHGRAPRAGDTDWSAIVALYDRLAACEPSPVVRLNRAVAIAEARGPEQALPLVDALAQEGALERYHLLHVARGELLARLGRGAEAVRALEHAASLAPTAPERRFLASRIAALSARA